MKKKLQIFISSTYEDLKDERQAAVSAILKSGHFPAGMELFTAGDKSQLEIIKKWIDESDVFMLILGGRYGSVEPDSGASYTEIEYNYATQQNKPLFAVVIKDDALEEKVKEAGTSVIEKERPTELKLFKEKVLSNMSSFFEDEKDIKLAVLESIPELANSRELSGWVSGKDVPDTKGLVDEISRLNAEVSELVKENSVLSKKLSNNKVYTTKEEFSELVTLLKSIKLVIPKSVTESSETTTNDLFSIFINVKDSLVTGVTNQVQQHQSTYWIYENVCPKLQIHGLVENEKVPSVRYRRFAITKKGQALLAHIEKKKLLKQ